jgi:two-component system chemotaxis response regulator CheY
MIPERARVLIVDDEPMIRRVVRGLLRHSGVVDIDEACDGAEALDLFRMGAYDLVLSDWNMPRVTGLELLKTIRHGPSKRQTPVVLVSAEVTQQRRLEALANGADSFITKPFDATTLCEQVLSIISRIPSARVESYVHEESNVPL